MKKFFLACALFFNLMCAVAQPAVIPPAGEQYLFSLLERIPLIDTLQFNSGAGNASEADEEEAWKTWETVANYTYGKDRGSMPMIADLQALHPYFRYKIAQLISECSKQGIELRVVETFRTRAKQAEYFRMGRKYTRSKGGKSKHQYGLAVDVVPIIDSVAVWDNVALWKKIGITGEKLGLRWGGRWRAPYDPAHFEWLGGIATYHLAKGYQPVVPKTYLEQYPCMEEEIKLLQKHYDAWEAEQAVSARNPSPAKSSSLLIGSVADK